MQMLKRALIAYVNSIKAVWSKLAHPLDIVSKRKGNVKDYRIYGNSVQDGTPTPENPIEVQSVGELVTEGEYTGKYKVPVTVKGDGVYEPYIKPQNYNIYLDEPLRKVGDYADLIDFGKKSDINKVGVTKVKSISWNKQSNVTATDGTVLYRYEAMVRKKRNFVGGYSAMGSIFCNGLPNISYNYGRNDKSISERVDNSNNGTGRIVRILTSEYSTVADMLAAFGEFDIYYILDDTKVTETPINLPKLPQFKGTTIYEVQTAVPPSGIEVCYYE